MARTGESVGLAIIPGVQSVDGLLDGRRFVAAQEGPRLGRVRAVEVTRDDVRHRLVGPFARLEFLVDLLGQADGLRHVYDVHDAAYWFFRHARHVHTTVRLTRRFRETQVGPRQQSGMSLLSDLLQSIVDMPFEFAEVATQGSILDSVVATSLILVGAVLVVIPSAVFGYLVFGAAVDILLPDSGTVSHP